MKTEFVFEKTKESKELEHRLICLMYGHDQSKAVKEEIKEIRRRSKVIYREQKEKHKSLDIDK